MHFPATVGTVHAYRNPLAHCQPALDCSTSQRLVAHVLRRMPGPAMAVAGGLSDPAAVTLIRCGLLNPGLGWCGIANGHSALVRTAFGESVAPRHLTRWLWKTKVVPARVNEPGRRRSTHLAVTAVYCEALSDKIHLQLQLFDQGLRRALDCRRRDSSCRRAEGVCPR